MIGDTKPKSQEEKRLDAMGGGVGEFTNDEQNSERFNDYDNNVSVGQYNHVEGKGNTATPATGYPATYNTALHVEGQDNTASGYAAHVEGIYNSGTGNYHHVEGMSNTVTGTLNHVEGMSNTVTGTLNHVEGYNNPVSGSYCHVEGNHNTVAGQYNHVIGDGNTVDSNGSKNTVGGESNSVTGRSNAVSGGNHTVSGDYNLVTGTGNTSTYGKSVVGGLQNQTDSEATAVFGARNINTSSAAALVTGQDNKNVSGGTNSIVAGNHNTNSGDDALVIGDHNTNSQSDAIMCGGGGTNTSHYISVTNNSSEVFYVGTNGACYAEGGYSSPAADYAEYFEWADGNPKNEDRRGMLVQLIGDKIAPAHGDDILGIISACPSVVGNAYPEHWHGRYKRDIFGAYILDENGDKQISEDYDKDREYIPRSERPEWSPVGILGQLVIRDNGKCQPGGYVEARQGMGVPTFTETNIRCIKRIDDKHCLALIK